MERGFTVRITSCAQCELFDNDGGRSRGVCDFPLRHHNGISVYLDERCNAYEEIHPDCPLLSEEGE